jgi:hypothetical protein
MADEALRERVARIVDPDAWVRHDKLMLEQAALPEVSTAILASPSTASSSCSDHTDIVLRRWSLGCRAADEIAGSFSKADRIIATLEAHRGEQRLQAHELTFDPRWHVEMFGGGRGDEDEAAAEVAEINRDSIRRCRERNR